MEFASTYSTDRFIMALMKILVLARKLARTSFTNPIGYG
jgi:hypothetical protein